MKIVNNKEEMFSEILAQPEEDNRYYNSYVSLFGKPEEVFNVLEEHKLYTTNEKLESKLIKLINWQEFRDWVYDAFFELLQKNYEHLFSIKELEEIEEQAELSLKEANYITIEDLVEEAVENYLRNRSTSFS